MGIPQQPPRQLIDSVVAVVDDDKRIRQALERALRLEGYGVVTASDGVKALEISDKADVMVLDVTMPNLGGIDVCRQLRAQGSELPVLLLTARHGTEDRIVGLDSGADDYLAKPFVLEELLARIRALLRRRRPADLPLEAATLCFEDLRLDQLARQVHREDQLLALTRTEYELLELLLEHPNQVLTRDQIYEAVWGYDSALASNSLEVYIGYLRRKTEAGNRSRVIHTVRGVGYVLRSS
ncbi:MAG: response regulator transcription factor [Actinomycetota bacterium]|nr:response regulator transcription factor [Actinomycetota bacterium]